MACRFFVAHHYLDSTVLSGSAIAKLGSNKALDNKRPSSLPTDVVEKGLGSKHLVHLEQDVVTDHHTREYWNPSCGLLSFRYVILHNI